MYQSTAAKLYDVTADGGVHISVEANKTPALAGHLVNEYGEEVAAPRRSLMVRVDSKVAETIELRKGTLWIVATMPVLLMLLFNYGGAMLGWARDEQTQKAAVLQAQTEIRETREDVKALTLRMDELQRSLAEKKGYEKGVADTKK